MHKAQATKTVCGDARALQVRQFYAPGIADDDVFDIAFAVNESSYLATRLVREFR